MKRTLAELSRGRVALGMQCFSGSASIIEAMAAGGIDFVIIDCEHSLNGFAEITQGVRAAQAQGTDALVRVSVIDARLGALLDFGVDGLVLSRADAHRLKDLLRECLYLPDGERGACPAVRSAAYGTSDWSRFARDSNSGLSLIALIEDARGVNDAEFIASCEQVRILFVGAFDLAASCGIDETDLRHPVLSEMLRQVARAAQRHGKSTMVSVGVQPDPAYVDWLARHGVRVFSNGADVQIVRATALAAGRLKSIAHDQAEKGLGGANPDVLHAVKAST